MAAHKQGKFFEMVKELYDHQQDQSKPGKDPAKQQELLLTWAKEIGLDLEKFKADLQDPEVARYVHMDAKAGQLLGVGGTPTMFLNGKKLEARELDEFKKAIDAELAITDKLMKAGASAEDAYKKRVLSQPGGVQFAELVIERKPVELDPPKPKGPEAAEKPEAVAKTVMPMQVDPAEPAKGPADALVTIAECSDFQ